MNWEQAEECQGSRVLRNCLEILPEDTEENDETFSHDSRPLRHCSRPRPSKQEEEVLTTT